MKKIIVTLIILAVIGMGFYFAKNWIDNKLYRNPGLTCGNGRIEATEINIAAKLAGKVEEVKVKEGDMVEKDQVLVKMQTNVLEANLAQAKARLVQANATEVSYRAMIAVRQANVDSAKAEVEQLTAETHNAQRNYERYKKLNEQNVETKQKFEDAETEWLSKKAELVAKHAAVKEAEANLEVAKADAEAAKANILAAQADIESIKADIDDSILKAPLMGRVQYRVAEPGEVLSAGGRALNMVDLTDVYMTFFLPEQMAGMVKIGSEARIILDVMPDIPVPAKISYVASVAQFTPKTVETKIERQKLMFRIKAHVDRSLLEQHIDVVKTGLPGMVWVKIDDNMAWPEELKTLMERGLTIEDVK